MPLHIQVKCDNSNDKVKGLKAHRDKKTRGYNKKTKGNGMILAGSGNRNMSERLRTVE